MLSINDLYSQNLFGLMTIGKISLVSQLSLYIPGHLNQTQILNELLRYLLFSHSFAEVISNTFKASWTYLIDLALVFGKDRNYMVFRMTASKIFGNYSIHYNLVFIPLTK